ITLRSGWQDRDATFVGFKAGEIGSSHGHLDGGNFVLEALGVRWAYDIGGDDYALPGYFSKPQRWTYYRLRAEGHNTLVINPGAGADQVDGAKLPVTLYTSEPNDERAATVMDLTGAYGITKTWRGIQLFKNRRWVLIQDELQAATPANVWWFMHFRSATTSAAIQDDGASAMLTQGSDRLWFKIVSGGGTFAISNAVPLPTSPNPSGQANNDSYRKLAIHLTNVTNTTLAVLIVPLTPGENPPTGSLSLVPLTDWALGMSNTLVIRTNSAEKWSGAVSPIWNTNSLNWRTLTSGTVTNYNDGDPGDMVVFDDTLTANSAITLNTAVSPGSMTFSNSTTAYTLSGSGSVNGAGGLIKSGVNRLTLSTSNTFSGTIDISGGSVVITNAAALGLGPKTINVKSALGNYAELHLNGSGGAITLPAECSFDTYGDTAFAGNIVNDSGDNIVNGSFNMNSGGGSPKIAVLNGSLTFNGDITCINGSSGKTLQLAGGGTNFINGVVQDGIQQARLTVLGGDWTLTNTNLYTGVTTVSGAGTLRVNGALMGGGAVTVQTGATLAGNGAVNAPVTVSNGGILRAGNSSGVGNLTLASLTLGTASGNAQTVNVTAAAMVAVLGALTNRGTTTINFSSASAITPGVYPLITYTGATVTSGFVLGSLPPRVAGTLQYSAGSIDLIIATGTDWPKWAGTASPIWDTNAINWRLVNAGTPTAYIDGNPGDAVLFDDSLTLNPSIALNRTVNPAAVTFSNITTAYTLSGSGGIAGAGTLTKYGTNTLTLSTANSFSGTVTVVGRVIINNSAALGIGSKTVIVKSTAGNYAELHLNGSGGPITLPASFRFDTYGDAVFAGNLVNDAGDNVINSSLNMASGGGNPKIAVLGGSLTFNGDIWCTNGSSSKTMQLAGVGVNTINGQIRNGNKASSLLVLGGTWILNNMNTYSGATAVATNAALVVNGAAGTGAVTVQNGGQLSGNGLLGGATTIQAGGTLSPGNSVGTLTLANKNLSLGGTAIMEIGRNGAVLTNDQVAGISICTEGGTLIVTNIGSSALQVGDSFQLFAATNYAGAFTQIIYPAGYTFTNSLNVDGRIWVASAPSTVPPDFAPGGISRLPDRNIAITATGDLGTAFRLWATTNLGLTPVTSTWTLLTNGTVTVSPFTIVDNSASNFPQRFYLFSAP
ncbi:MAG: heparinase II/III domain-containing protein, partial [Verrucomicrobiota bacterium]